MPYNGFKENRRIEFDIEDVEDIKNNFTLFTEYVTPRISRKCLFSILDTDSIKLSISFLIFIN